MCGTASLANLSLGANVFGGVQSAIGSFYGARGQRTALEGQARSADFSAKMADLEAGDALNRGAQAEQTVRVRGAQLKGRQRVALAANGQDLGAGSALNILSDTDVMTEADALAADANGRREAANARMRAAGYRGEAAMARAGAGAISPGLAFGTSLIGSAGRVADSWYRFKNPARPGG